MSGQKTGASPFARGRPSQRPVSALAPPPENSRPPFSSPMQTETDAHPESVNNRLADFLDSRKKAVLDEWLQRVRQDPPRNGPAPEVVISQRLSSLLDDLNATLRRPSSTWSADGITEDSGVDCSDGATGDGALCGMLCEIKHFRANLLYHLRTFEDLHPDYGMAAMLFVSTLVHRHLDDMMIEIAREHSQA